jgi:XRE family aerobic/anaerobic benzoate catabolism transcriptional regulator
MWKYNAYAIFQSGAPTVTVHRSLGQSASQPPRDGIVNDSLFLKVLGERVRKARANRGMTRKILARDSGVSERYLAQLESGQGNVSILLLHDIAQALNMQLEMLLAEGPEAPVDLVHTTEFLRRLPASELQQARRLLVEHFGRVDQAGRYDRIALIGLRGAGKSTLGAKLAAKLDLPFLELDRQIEQEAGVPLGVIFELYGQSGFRRLERRCLEAILGATPKFVMATGGSLVSEPATFERLRTTCFTVWLKASAEDHMQRVIAQGDVRPMADNRESMEDLQRILAVREPLYRKADAAIDTSTSSPSQSVRLVLEARAAATAEMEKHS